LLVGTAMGEEKKMPDMPPPQAEHEWLMKFVGDWNAEVEMFMEPGQPSEKARGTESVRAIGGFWIQTEYKGSFMDKPFTGTMTLGYDVDKKRFVGTWVDSMGSHLWTYEGTLNASKTTLTLEAEGPCPAAPGKLMKFEDSMELKSADHRVLSSSMQGENGEWVRAMTIEYRRK